MLVLAFCVPDISTGSLFTPLGTRETFCTSGCLESATPNWPYPVLRAGDRLAKPVAEKSSSIPRSVGLASCREHVAVQFVYRPLLP